MSLTAVGAVVTGGVLGVTHALEPDHIAGISSLTSRYGNSRLSALVGVCFSAGHVALVIAWLVLAYLVLGETTFPAILDTAGTLVVSIILGVFGALLTLRGYRAAAAAHARDHANGDVRETGTGELAKFPGSDDDVPDHDVHPGGHTHHHDEPHVHLPLFGGVHDHDHSVRTYLKTGLVGALFTLSPPLSMIVFLGTVIPAQGFSVAVVAVGAYALGITATMATIGAGVGGLFGAVAGRGRLFGVLRLVTGVVVVALAATIGASVIGPLL